MNLAQTPQAEDPCILEGGRGGGGGQGTRGGGQRTCISDVGAMLQGKGVKLGQALQHSLQANIPQIAAVTEVQGLQRLEACQAACPLICNLHTPAQHVTC